MTQFLFILSRLNLMIPRLVEKYDHVYQYNTYYNNE